jgi:glycosyltransferase involved in cell wall biosynthesis
MYKAVRICRDHRFDVIHVHWPVPHALFGWAGKKFSGSRLVLTFYGVELRWVKNRFPFLRKFISWAINRADLVTCISSHTQQEIRNYSHKPATIIPFGAGFDVGTDGEFPEAQPPEILFVGRLVERKGVRYLVDAFFQLSREMDVKLYIVGEGPEKQTLDKQIQRLGIQDRAILTGSIPEGELRVRYQRCSVFVLPAVVDSKGDTEGLGVVLIEALLYGKPVIASRLGGIVDIVKDGRTGILVPEKDIRQLAQALKKLLTDLSLRRRLAADGRQFVQQHFSWDRIIAQLKSAYAGITN